MREPVVNQEYPESGPFGGRAVCQRLMKTSPEPCQGHPSAALLWEAALAKVEVRYDEAVWDGNDTVPRVKG